MARVKRRVPRHHAPEDSGVLVGQRHGCFLPAHAGLELH